MEKFPGHIACDGASKSEIVVPIVKEGKVCIFFLLGKISFVLLYRLMLWLKIMRHVSTNVQLGGRDYRH